MNLSQTTMAVVMAALALSLFALRPSEPAPALEPAYPVAAPRGYVCRRAESAPAIDGKLNDDAWAAAPWSEPFRDIEGDRQPEPPLRTAAPKILGRLLSSARGLAVPSRDSVVFHRELAGLRGARVGDSRR